MQKRSTPECVRRLAMSNNSNGVPSGEPDHVTQFLPGAFGRIDLGLFAPAQSCWF